MTERYFRSDIFEDSGRWNRMPASQKLIEHLKTNHNGVDFGVLVEAVVIDNDGFGGTVILDGERSISVTKTIERIRSVNIELNGYRTKHFSVWRVGVRESSTDHLCLDLKEKQDYALWTTIVPDIVLISENPTSDYLDRVKRNIRPRMNRFVLVEGENGKLKAWKLPSYFLQIRGGKVFSFE